ncbi:hypothetical protein CM15mP35_08590 [bacterium]|nr:MAG: hypothetical protein CM15mP35_08590 [bacterium]
MVNLIENGPFLKKKGKRVPKSGGFELIRRVTGEIFW